MWSPVGGPRTRKSAAHSIDIGVLRWGAGRLGATTVPRRRPHLAEYFALACWIDPARSSPVRSFCNLVPGSPANPERAADRADRPERSSPDWACAVRWSWRLPGPGLPPLKKKPAAFSGSGLTNNPGSDLLSHAVSHAVPSAVAGL